MTWLHETSTSSSPASELPCPRVLGQSQTIRHVGARAVFLDHAVTDLLGEDEIVVTQLTERSIPQLH
jgi:hypothetical protein